MDQGKRLVEVLKEKFKDEPNINISKGTCTKLEFADESFDFVLLNGVIHHTKAD